MTRNGAKNAKRKREGAIGKTRNEGGQRHMPYTEFEELHYLLDGSCPTASLQKVRR